MSARVRIGDRVRIKRGVCGAGHVFTVEGLAARPTGDGRDEIQVYGPNYGPVRLSEVEHA